MTLAELSPLLFEQFPDLPEWLVLVAAAVIHVTLLGLFFGLPAGVGIWGERKVSARIHDRIGPTRVGGRFGWLQSAADGIKLIQKEDLCPKAADPILFYGAPYLVVVSAFASFLFLPFSADWIALALETGLFFAIAVHGLEVLGIILAGWSSGSKWSLFGGMREAAQLVSYEIPLGICAAVPVIAAGSMDLNEIGAVQAGPAWNWLIFANPFQFVAFWVFFTVTLAACKRAPFDLAEAESELVGGFHTEYSGMRWSLFFLAEYASMLFVAGVAVMLFLGGWWTGLGIEPAVVDAVGPTIARVLGFGVFMFKASLLVVVQMWVRWTLPRLRIDQVMTTGLKYLLPISCALLLGAALWPLAVYAVFERPTVFPREGTRLKAQDTSVSAEAEVARCSPRRHGNHGGRTEGTFFETEPTSDPTPTSEVGTVEKISFHIQPSVRPPCPLCLRGEPERGRLRGDIEPAGRLVPCAFDLVPSPEASPC